MMKRQLLFLGFLLCSSLLTFGQSYSVKTDIAYRADSPDEYAQERCLLDVYYPEDKTDFTTVVWFHGGGLTGGNKELPEFLKDKGIAVVGVGYRLSPGAKVEEIIQDAAHAVKWTFDHIEDYGGSKHKIVLSGHSAGGYLDLMLTLNKSYLQQVGLDADQLMGVVPFSAQCITHFTARDEQNISINQPTIDEMAPLYWVRKSPVPVTLITGDRELEMVGRYEENAYLLRMFKIVGHDQVKLYELDGYGHNMTYPAFPILIEEIQRWEKAGR